MRFAAEVLIAPFESSGKLAMVSSISATIFLVGIWCGVGANLGPLFKIARPWVESGLVDRLTAHFDRSVAIVGVDSFLKFCNFISCLVEMLSWTDLALFFRNSVKREKKSSDIRTANFLRFSLITWSVERICSWQMLILALKWILVGCSLHDTLEHRMAVGGENRRDFGNRWFSSALWVKLKWRWWTSSL